MARLEAVLCAVALLTQVSEASGRPAGPSAAATARSRRSEHYLRRSLLQRRHAVLRQPYQALHACTGPAADSDAPAHRCSTPCMCLAAASVRNGWLEPMLIPPCWNPKQRPPAAPSGCQDADAFCSSGDHATGRLCLQRDALCSCTGLCWPQWAGPRWETQKPAERICVPSPSSHGGLAAAAWHREGLPSLDAADSRRGLI